MDELQEALARFRTSQHNAGHFERGHFEKGRVGEIFEDPEQEHAADDMLACLAAAGAPLTPPETWRVLDVGSSLGLFAFPLARRVREVVGIDVEPEAIDVANAWKARSGTGNVTFFAGDAAIALDEAVEGTFDVIVLKTLTEHMTSPERLRDLFVSVRKLLAPGGAAFVMTANYLIPYEPHLSMSMPPLSPVWLVRALASLRGLHGASDESFFATLLIISPQRLAGLAREAGLRVFDAGARHKAPAFLAGLRQPTGRYARYRWLSHLLGLPGARQCTLALIRAFRLYPTVTYVLTPQ